jgi:hypothetical protein
VTYTTGASSATPDEAVFILTNLAPSVLRPGTNVLAVEVHQVNGTSSDVSFDLHLLGQFDQARPRLAISPLGPNLGLEWPAQASDFLLEAATDLNLGDWQPVGALPWLNNGRVQVVLPPGPGNRFHRLSLP